MRCDSLISIYIRIEIHIWLLQICYIICDFVINWHIANVLKRVRMHAFSGYLVVSNSSEIKLKRISQSHNAMNSALVVSAP